MFGPYYNHRSLAKYPKGWLSVSLKSRHLVMWEEHGLNVGHFTSIWHYPSFGKGMKISKILVLGLGGRRELSKEASPRCEELARVHKWTCDRNQSILTWDRFVLSFTCYAYVEANPYPLRTLASKVVHHSSLKTTLCFLDVGRVRGGYNSSSLGLWMLIKPQSVYSKLLKSIKMHNNIWTLLRHYKNHFLKCLH